MPGRFRLRESRLTPCPVQRQLLPLYLQFNSSKRFFTTEDKVSLHVSLHVRVDSLKHLAAQHLVVGVQADLDHVVDGPLAPLAVAPSLVEQLEGVVRVARVPLM